MTALHNKRTILKASGVIATVTVTFVSAIIAQQPRAVDSKILRTAGTAKDTLPGTWLTYGLTQTEQRYSQLKQIDESNVGKLGLAWSAPLTMPPNPPKTLKPPKAPEPPKNPPPTAGAPIRTHAATPTRSRWTSSSRACSCATTSGATP